jgi:hypothetical protein
VYGDVQLSSSAFAQAALVMRSETPLPRFKTPNDDLWLESPVIIAWEPAAVTAPRYTIELVDADRVLIDKRDVNESRVSWNDLKPGAYVVRVTFNDAGGRHRANTLRFALAGPDRASALREARSGAQANDAERAAFDALLLFFGAAAR